MENFDHHQNPEQTKLEAIDRLVKDAEQKIDQAFNAYKAAKIIWREKYDALTEATKGSSIDADTWTTLYNEHLSDQDEVVDETRLELNSKLKFYIETLKTNERPIAGGIYQADISFPTKRGEYTQTFKLDLGAEETSLADLIGTLRRYISHYGVHNFGFTTEADLEIGTVNYSIKNTGVFKKDGHFLVEVNSGRLAQDLR